MGRVTRHTAVIDERGRLVIPGAFRQALGMNPGDAVVLESEGDELGIVSARRQRDAVETAPAGRRHVR
ncbi:MAG: AbrB/MazE/SpoVT family DNA-binding domain-containing protein [Solirubrobacteraceae bacterium]